MDVEQRQAIELELERITRDLRLADEIEARLDQQRSQLLLRRRQLEDVLLLSEEEA